MGSSLETRRERWELGCGWWRRCGVLCLLLLLLDRCRCSGPASTACRPPCENAICPPTESPCNFGTYELCNGCCTACAAGPNVTCLSYGSIYPRCGDGLRCAGETRYFPGVCEWVPGKSCSIKRQLSTSYLYCIAECSCCFLHVSS